MTFSSIFFSAPNAVVTLAALEPEKTRDLSDQEADLEENLTQNQLDDPALKGKLLIGLEWFLDNLKKVVTSSLNLKY